MKTGEARRLKSKARTVGGRVKAKLPQYKALGKGSFRGSEKALLRCRAKKGLASSRILTSKRSNRSRTPVAARKYTVDIFSESNVDSEETGNERNCTGSPVVVEALSENLSGLCIPAPEETQDAPNAPSERARTGSKKKENRQSRKNTRQRPGKPESKEGPRVPDEPGTVDNEQEPTSPIRQNKSFQLSPDQTPPRFYSIKNRVIAVMEERSRFCFTGKIRLSVVYGSVEVYGFKVTQENGPVEVYSPRGNSSVAIENSTASSSPVDDIWAGLSGQGITRDTENRLVADLDQLRPGMAVLALSNLENQLTRFLQAFYPFRLFPRVKNSSHLSWTDPKRAELLLQSCLYPNGSGCKDLVVDPRIASEVSEKMLDSWRTNQWTCTLIAGGKSVGKSTSTRCLINNLLPVSRGVVLLDLDPGQAECTPPGCISYSLIDEPLLGPNFTHLKRPVYQLYIGDVNVARCITRYIEGMKMLIDRLTSCPALSRLPVVVNTMGFAQGLGWDIAVFTIKLTRPSLVVQIMSKTAKNNFGSYLSKEVVNQQKFSWSTWSANLVDVDRPCDHELLVVRSRAERKTGNEAWNMEPYQQRELVTISYLSQIVQSPENSLPSFSSLAISINEAVPFVAPFSSLYISVPSSCVPDGHVLSVVNGSIVALCGLDTDDHQMDQNDQKESASPSSLRVLNRLPLCDCYGFGIVRGVDMEKEEIFINTPLTCTMMGQVNCLVGCIPIPETLLQLNQQRNAPYAGGNELVPTGREPRRGYFRMRYRANV